MLNYDINNNNLNNMNNNLNNNNNNVTNHSLMDDLINKIIVEPYDYTYIAIGSANMRNLDTACDRQQFPPFLEDIYNNTDKTIRIINIDCKFEKPYYLQQYLKNIISNNNNLTKDRLDIYYLEEVFIFDSENTLTIFDLINKIIMEQNKVLIVSDYTGRGLKNFETYFYNLYSTTEYKNKFNELICYDFNYTNECTCFLNLTKNFPIIRDNKFIKFIFNNREEFIELYINNDVYCQIILQKCFIIKIKKFVNINLYTYRNLINNNIIQCVKNNIQFSIFKEININNFNKYNVMEILVSKLTQDFFPILCILADNNILEMFDNLIINLHNLDYNLYKLSNDFTTFINSFCKSLDIDINDINI